MNQNETHTDHKTYSRPTWSIRPTSENRCSVSFAFQNHFIVIWDFVKIFSLIILIHSNWTMDSDDEPLRIFERNCNGRTNDV